MSSVVATQAAAAKGTVAATTSCGVCIHDCAGLAPVHQRTWDIRGCNMRCVSVGASFYFLEQHKENPTYFQVKYK
eukprot:7168615-Alexandrium_andersonii.AAC.1